MALNSGKPIPSSIQKELQIELQCDSLANLKGPYFTRALTEINKGILKRYKENKDYEKYFSLKDRKEVFTAKTLHRYFAGENIRTDSLQALMCFLNYEPARLEFGKERKKNADNIHFDHLVGAWYSYVYDTAEPTANKVKRTVLFLSQKNKQYLDVQYEGLRGRFTGYAEIVNNSLLFSIDSLDKNIRIYLCAELPVDGNNHATNRMILNVYCLSNSLSAQPVISNVIMVKNNKADIIFSKPETIERFLNTRPVTLVYGDLKPQINQNDILTLEEWQEREIISYLSRNKKVNKRLKVFLPNSFEYLITRNNTADQLKGHDNYYKLKIKLDKNIFYVFNRYRQKRDEVAVFSYTFDFVDEEKVCTAYRHPIGNPNKIDFSGEVFLKGEKLYMSLTDANLQRHRLFIAPFNCEKNESSGTFVFRGITSTVSVQTASPMALRELILCIPKNDNPLSSKVIINDNDRTNGYISYRDFCLMEKTILKNEEKLFLANQAMCTLTFPAKTDNTFTYYRQDKARKFEGLYSIFSLEKGNYPLKMSLNIDALSQVILKIKYDPDPIAETYIYYGICEFYNNVLRLSLHLSSEYTNDERHYEFISDPIKEKNYKLPNLITGISLTSGDENLAQAARYFLVKNDWLSKKQAGKEKNQKPIAGIGPVGISALSEMLQFASDEHIDITELKNYIDNMKK